jgi:hypothetical protein
MAPVSIVAMWEAWFQKCEHRSALSSANDFPKHIHIYAGRLCKQALFERILFPNLN